MSGVLDWVSGWHTLQDTDPIQIGDSIRITVQFNNVPLLGPDSGAIQSAFAEYVDLSVASASDTALSGPGATVWQITGSSLDNVTAGTLKGQVYQAMSAISGMLAVPLVGVTVIKQEIQIGSPSAPDTGLRGAVNSTFNGTADNSDGTNLLGINFTLGFLALIVLGIAYLAGFVGVRRSV